MVKNVSVFALVVGVLITGSTDGNNWQSEVYDQVRGIFSAHSFQRPESAFLSIRGGGFENDLPEGAMTTNFLHYCQTVSNNFDRIVNEWPSYETNDMVRFTTLSAVCYCGSSHYTNFIHRTLAPSVSVTTQRVDTAVFLLSPYGTPLERFLVMNYDQPGVSNLVERIRSVVSAGSATSSTAYCDEVLSGEAKREYIEMRDAGVL